MYLTYTEFKKLNPTHMEEDKFEGLLPKSAAIMDNITNRFYVRNDIEKDNPWRVRQFKLALCSQIDYFNALGASTFEGINSAPQTFSAGRTSVTNNSRNIAEVANAGKTLVAEDVFVFLEGTGLLYAGVATW